METVNEYINQDDSFNISVKANNYPETSYKINKQMCLTNDDIIDVNKHGAMVLRDISKKREKDSFFHNIKSLINRHKHETNRNIVFVTPETNFKLWDNVRLDLIPSDSALIFSTIKDKLNENTILSEAHNFLEETSSKFNLGDVELIMEDEDSCLPTFNIKASASLSADERIELSDKIFNNLYNHYKKFDKLEEFSNFYFRLIYEE